MQGFQPRAPLNISSIAELLEKNAKKYPQKIAIYTVDPHSMEFDSLSYGQLKDLVYQVASFLDYQGIKKDDKYAILMPNSAEVLLLELAGALIGATITPLDSKRDTLDRKIFKIRETDSKALFVNSEDTKDLSRIRMKIPKLKIIEWKNFSEFKSLLPKAGEFELNNSLDADYVILYTSGTTNMPKGVPLTLRACLLNAMGIATWQKMTDKEIFNIVLPLHHINSTIFCLSMLLMGGTAVLNKVYSASKFWEVVAKFKATNTSIVPTIIHDLLNKKKEFFKSNLDTQSLKRICIGSAPVLPEQTLKFYQTFKIRITQGYGQTETALRVSGVPVDLSERSYFEMLKTNSIGVELPNNRLSIMDSKNDPKPEGMEGEICISGPTLGREYLNDPSATRHSFKHGWFHSGDLGYFKNMEITLKSGERFKDKFFFLIGRIKEIIIKGGINISPSAIEDALLKSFPEIEQVCVIGTPDLRMGEEIAAVVVPKIGEDKKRLEEKILKAKEIQGLSKFEIPKKVFFLESLPKTSTGKIQRVEAKTLVLQALSESSIRVIRSEEKEILEEAVKINNQGFKDTPASLNEFAKRAKNALLLGAFEEGKLVGSLSILQIKKYSLEKFKTWKEATAQGSLDNNYPQGDVLVCVAISVKREEKEQREEKADEEKLKKLAKREIKNYLNSNKDFVINFHKKPKGGLGGAGVWKIIEGGRKEDKEAMGYNVVMRYPKIIKKITKDPNASASVKLIEEALNIAQEKGIKEVFAFSRPGGFRDYLIDL